MLDWAIVTFQTCLLLAGRSVVACSSSFSHSQTIWRFASIELLSFVSVRSLKSCFEPPFLLLQLRGALLLMEYLQQYLVVFEQRCCFQAPLDFHVCTCLPATFLVRRTSWALLQTLGAFSFPGLIFLVLFRGLDPIVWSIFHGVRLLSWVYRVQPSTFHSHP